MTNFTPTPGEHCLLNGAKVLYIGKSEDSHIFENAKGSLKKFDNFDYFEPIDETYEQISHICIKEIKVTNCESMNEALKKLYDAGMLVLPEPDNA